MEGYSVKISYSSIELSAKDKIKLKDTTNAKSIDELTQESSLIIDYAYHVILNVHNEKSDNKDYTKVVVVDTNGNKFVTGSNSFLESLTGIVEEMKEAGEANFEIEVYRRDSKNYKGKQFITCSIV